MKLKEALSTGTPSIGSWVTIPHPSIVEIMSDAGFDWLTVDMEHTATGYESAQVLITVIQANNMEALVRVAKNDSVLIKRSMDIGADGVIVPNVCTKSDAELAVKNTKYPLEGHRGVGLYRAQKYGTGFESYKEWLQDSAIIIAQIEHIDAVKNIEEILSVTGIDGFIIGPYDLSASMGFPGEFGRPEVLKALDDVKFACQKLSRPLGFHSVPSDESELIDKFQAGFNFGAYSLDFFFLGDKAREGMKEIRKAIK